MLDSDSVVDYFGTSGSSTSDCNIHLFEPNSNFELHYSSPSCTLENIFFSSFLYVHGHRCTDHRACNYLLFDEKYPKHKIYRRLFCNYRVWFRLHLFLGFSSGFLYGSKLGRRRKEILCMSIVDEKITS